MTAEALIDQQLGLGLFIIGAGLFITAMAGPIAAMNEAFDAVGSTRSEVKPARWRILLTRVVGVGIFLAGAWYLATFYFSM